MYGKKLAMLKFISINYFDERGINVMWLLSFMCLLMRIIAGFERYTGYPNAKQIHFIANTTSCVTNRLSVLLTSCLTAI